MALTSPETIVEMAKNPVWIRDILYLHEPSTCRPEEERVSREAIISHIIAKPAYASTEGYDLNSA